MPLFDKNKDENGEPLDDGLPKKKRKEPEEKKIKVIKKTHKHALTPERMFFQREEREMYAEYFNRLKEEVEEKFGASLTVSQEITIDNVCYAVVRMERKSRMESNFGRFFDRTATQDPLNQINAGLKALGLLSVDKKDIGASNSNTYIKDKLAQEAADAELAGEAGAPSFADWQKRVLSEIPQYKIRTPEILPTYMDDDLVFNNEEVENEEAD